MFSIGSRLTPRARALALRSRLAGAPAPASSRPARAARHLAGRALLAGMLGGIAPATVWAVNPDPVDGAPVAGARVADDAADGEPFLAPVDVLTRYVSVNPLAYVGGASTDAAAGASGSLAIGLNARTAADAFGGVAIGADVSVVRAPGGATDPGSGGVALGNNASTTTSSVAIGPRAAITDANAIGAIAVGARSVADQLGTAVGCTTRAETSSLAAGYGANAARFATALGANANATGDHAIAIGTETAGRGLRSVALGSGSIADDDDLVSVGTPVRQRKIRNVGSGVLGTDAVNLAQLQSSTQTIVDSVNELDARAVVYDDPAVRDRVTLAGNDATTISNLAAGTAPSDAVTVSQLREGTRYLSATPDTRDGGAVDATASGDGATAVGPGALASGLGTAVGTLAQAAESGAAFGRDARTVATGVALGSSSQAMAAEATAVGLDALAAEASATALGAGGTAIAEQSVALGANAAATAPLSVALGADAFATDPFTVSVGNPDVKRQIVNVAAGSQGDHAVTVAQLGEAGLIDANAGLARAVTYDALSEHQRVTLVGAGGTTLTNLQDAMLSETSTDAVTGRQLAATVEQVDSNTAMLDVNTRTLAVQGDRITEVTMTTAVQGQTLHDHGDQLEIGGTRLDIHDARLDMLARAADAAVYYDEGRASVTLSGTPPGSVPPPAGEVPGAPVQLKNVAAGQEATDAVNLAQLAAIGHPVGPDGLPLNPLVYDSGTDATCATLAGTGGTVLANVAPAAVSAASTQAVNGAQLFAQQDSIVNLGDRVSVLEVNSGSATNALVATHGDQQLEAAAVGDGTYGVAIGANASAQAMHSVGVGANVAATHENSVALGAGSATDRENSVSVGNPDNQRTVTNVAEGVQETDAANVGQTARVARVEATTALTQANAYTDQRFGALQGSLHDLDRSTRRGIAAAAALQQVAPYVPGKVAFNAGVAGYRGTGALALSVSRWNARGSLNWNAGVASGGGNSTIVRAGVGILLD